MERRERMADREKEREHNAFCRFRRRTIQGNSTHFGRSVRFVLASNAFHIRLSANICIECINDTLFSWNAVISVRPFTITPDKTIFFALLFFYRLVASVPHSLCRFQKRLNNELFHFFFGFQSFMAIKTWCLACVLHMCEYHVMCICMHFVWNMYGTILWWKSCTNVAAFLASVIANWE